MRSKDYMKKIFKHFSDFVSESSSRELEYFIFDSKFTTMFNKRIIELIRDVKDQGKDGIEITIIFNTEGEIALIDSYILGRYIGNNYNMHMQQHYKETKLNNVVKHVINGTDKSKKDYIILSYNILYNSLKSIYCDIKCKKDTLNEYIQLYKLKHCSGDACAIDVVIILILEDICKYIGIKDDILKESITYISAKRNSENN